MINQRLYNVAKRYIGIIERMERTPDAERLAELEEQRAQWHDKLLRLFKREGIPYQDREQVTRMAYKIVKDFE